MKKKGVCIVAILKNEEAFLDEWLIYHRMLGVDHFFLYDDDPEFPLKDFTRPYGEFVTVVNWHGMDKTMEGRCSQTKAYTHALENYLIDYEWVGFIDGDEFLVLSRHATIGDFLKEFKYATAVSLHWHVFGHNGYYDDPDGLITASLTRRMKEPGRNVKTFTRPEAIWKIESPHFCRTKQGYRMDANHRIFGEEIYEGKTKIAHINHYQCRSFKNWMSRVERGDAVNTADTAPKDHAWRFTEEGSLKQFVTVMAKDKNEYEDPYMLRYKADLEKYIQMIRG